jgi:hypothetical protein
MESTNIAALTIPGATVLYFNDGTGERDLGYFESPNLEVEPKTEELKYYSNRSGKRRVAKTWSLQEELMIRFKLNSPILENLQAFFKGDAPEVVAGGNRFAIGASGYIEGVARLVCTPAPGMGMAFEIQIPKCQLKPNGSFNLDDKKVMELPMMLEVLDNYLATPTYPYGRVIVYEDEGSV